MLLLFKKVKQIKMIKHNEDLTLGEIDLESQEEDNYLARPCIRITDIDPQSHFQLQQKSLLVIRKMIMKNENGCMRRPLW